jgi:hypothetical protein
MPEKGSAKNFQQWDERSAGAWRDHIEVHFLTDDKITNDGIVAGLAKSQGTVVLASQHLTSAAVARQWTNVQRLQTYKLLGSVERWMDENDLDWRLRTTKHCKKTPFKCISAEEWVAQFAEVDPKLGRRAGAALLAQFRVIGPDEFAEYFSDLPEVDLSTFFLGADPHSGDFGLITPLAANIDNALLRESRRLPSLKNSSKVRLYCDGSWSGGETQRRIRCMYTQCTKKANALNPSQFLDVRIGFITDAAETIIERALQQLVDTSVIQKGFVRVTCPENNRLRLVGFRSGQRGLAFHNPLLLRYVDEDPKALQRLCKKIGEELSHKPLGTNEIASCIAFSHSLPAAMLPLFTFDGIQVTGANGQKFIWKSLLKSKHVSTGQDDDPDHHCERCPLADRAPKAAQH